MDGPGIIGPFSTHGVLVHDGGGTITASEVDQANIPGLAISKLSADASCMHEPAMGWYRKLLPFCFVVVAIL
jgi:hypothetical protein